MTDPGDFDCNFRQALPTDRDQLHWLIERCWLEVYSPYLPPAAIERFLAEDPIGTHLDVFLPFSEVAVVGNVIVGVVAAADGWVFSLFVAERLRGNRIGSCLLHNAVLSGGRWLEFPVFNLRAMSFYEASGWRRLGESFEDVGGTRVATFLMQVGARCELRDLGYGADG
ncbi:GNAT family N-acetyltransferase [Shinella sp. M27]|uniref:GNAT family N-acetyltransferase n=1 Tax=Shinella sp. M27 TaxID=3368614 RepID=UPI003BA0077E